MTTNNAKYDIIGDIHGHADKLIALLEHLGYKNSTTGYQHESRKVIFLGDFIDGGEHLRQHRKLLDIVMPMVNNGHALAVMGNHEFNALAYHTMHKGNYLRLHTQKNTEQHQAFLNEFDNEPEYKQEVLEFFYDLPLWIEQDGLRAIHACWDDKHIEVMRSKTPNLKLNPDLLVEASTKETQAYNAIEALLKGVEVHLPNGIKIKDKKGQPRDAVRVQWWKNDANTLGEVALPLGVDIGKACQCAIPKDIPKYTKDQPPCFVGHYWLEGAPAPLSSNVACLDYSVAKDGKLVAYRWSSEKTLEKENFVYL